MSTRNNNNNNNNNKDISKMNNAVSPLTISKNKTSNSSLGTSNNPLDVGWTIQKSKRNLSSSTNSEPNSPDDFSSWHKKHITHSYNSGTLRHEPVRPKRVGARLCPLLFVGSTGAGPRDTSDTGGDDLEPRLPPPPVDRSGLCGRHKYTQCTDRTMATDKSIFRTGCSSHRLGDYATTAICGTERPVTREAGLSDSFREPAEETAAEELPLRHRTEPEQNRS
ncbi:hypothetical protein ACI65C_012849 [Semiaphis heraclei]